MLKRKSVIVCVVDGIISFLQRQLFFNLTLQCDAYLHQSLVPLKRLLKRMLTPGLVLLSHDVSLILTRLSHILPFPTLANAIAMTREDKRKLYKCGQRFKTLENISTWERCYNENKTTLVKRRMMTSL